MLDLQSVDWNDLMEMRLIDSPSTSYDKFINKIKESMNKHMPIITEKFKPHKHKIQPWMTNGILLSMKKKDKLYRKWKKTHPEHVFYEQYKTDFKLYSNALRRVINNAKSNYYTETLDNYKSDIKKSWKIINDILNKKECKKIFQNLFKKMIELLMVQKT